MSQSERKSKFRYGRLAILGFGLIVLISVCIFFMTKSDKYQIYREINMDRKEAGTLEKIILDSEETKVKFLYYPSFDKESINKKVKAYLDSLPNEDGITFVDYESKEVSEQAYTTIRFHYQKLSMDQTLEKEAYKSFNFHNDTGEEVALQDVFRGGYERVLKNEVETQLGISIQELDTLSFLIQEDGIAFQNDDGKEVTLPYDTYKNIIKLKNKGLATQSLQRKRFVEVDPDKPMIALTFDDGPSPYTTSFMQVMEDNNATGTFFMLGKNVVANVDIVTHMYEQGFEIANHSWNHKNVSSDDRDLIKSQIFDTQDAIYQICGDEPTKFRPPYGAYNEVTQEVAGSGIDIALWNVDTLDWKNRDAQKTYENAKAGVRDGAIILFHDLYPTSLEAIEKLVPELVSQGYQLVTFSDIIKYRYSE